MEIWFEQSIGEAITQRTAEAKALAPPALSCEAANLSTDRAKHLIVSAIGDWRQELLIVFRRVGSGKQQSVRAGLVDMDGLAILIDEALKSEEVISIQDPTALGGCAFDISPEESPREKGDVELLLTAWGVHEPMVEHLAQELEEDTFRQRSSVRLER